MTAQASDKLINEHPLIDFGSLQLYGVIRGDIASNHGWGTKYQFLNPPKLPENYRTSSALWRGYVATFRLTNDGDVELVSYRFPYSSQSRVKQVHEMLTGDFWFVMKPAFAAPRVYIPFRDGRIVEETQQWIKESKNARSPTYRFGMKNQRKS